MNWISGGTFLLTLFNLIFVQSQDLCFTPRQAQGECKAITSCESVFSILKNRPITSEGADYLRRSQCGFEGMLPKVCCPLKDETPTRPPPTKPPSVKPISSNLIPDSDECGFSADNRIYGGEKAELEDFPWMVLVEYERPGGQTGFYCGGVLINKRYVLTAAHCLKGKDLPRNWKIISVRLGEYDTDTDVDCITTKKSKYCAPPAIDLPVEETIAHEDYNPYDINQYHDIALLRLARNVEYTDYIRPICLPKTRELLQRSYADKNLVVAGWGKTENRSESNVKLKLEVPVKPGEVCNRIYGQASVNLSKDQLCAGGQQGRDSCRGDSGGPLMTPIAEGGGIVSWYSVGVVSFGPSPCGMANWPGIYTRVASYVPWISKKMRA